MSGEISKTSLFMSGLSAQKKSAPAARAPGSDQAASPGKISGPSSSQTERVSIAVTNLNEKVQNLQKLLDGVDRNIGTLTASRELADQAIGILEEAGGITVRARDTLKADPENGTGPRMKELEQRFGSVLERLAQLVEKSDVNGINLLKGETVTTTFDANGKNPFETMGINLSPEALEFRKPDFSTAEGVTNSRIDVMNAMDMGITLRHIISSDLILMQTRQEFSQSTISTLADSSVQPKLQLGDEAANLLALHLRQQLSESDAPLAAESQQYLLKQF